MDTLTHDTPQEHDAPHGWRRWLFATNHKDIGTMYLIFSFVMLLEGGVLALLLRTELFEPGLQFFQPELFNQFTSMHGLIMIFGAIMPSLVGFANWMIPMQIGAADMAFARMNNFSFWLLPVGAMMLTASFFVPGGATPPAGRCTRHCRSKWVRAWTWPSSPCISWGPRPSWGPSISSSRS